jgi:hypothetical protein
MVVHIHLVRALMYKNKRKVAPNRVLHIKKHYSNNVQRPQHSVFSSEIPNYSDPVSLIDSIYVEISRIENNSISPQRDTPC